MTATIRLWNVSPWAETARFGGRTNWVLALAVLQAGWLASGLYDSTIRLWDVKTGKETVRLEGHTDWVDALCVLPDGRLASGSRDKTIRLWDIAAGREIACLEIDAWVVSLAALEGPRLVAGDSNGRVHWLEITV
jgi:WD40 repeat protein